MSCVTRHASWGFAAAQTIANTEWGRNPDGPHHWSYKPGFYAVNEHFQRVDGYWNHNVSLDKIAIHHYVLKSLEVPAPPSCLISRLYFLSFF